MSDSGTQPRVLLDRYELRERAGVGGMGEVWLGWDQRLQRDVAVKLLLPQLSDEPSFRQRFEVEARAAAALEHPNVVQVFDIDEDQGALFIVMERLPGPSLDRVLADGPLNEEEVRRVAADMLAGLAAAHAENVVHRDIKPGNLIRSAGGRWKVGDFGVAKDLASTAHLTLAGVPVGTPAYLAPEQLTGQPATPTTDLWAAAVVLREALTGERPFDGEDPISVAHAIQTVPLVHLATLRPDLSPSITAAVDTALARDPARRFVTASDMAAAIEGRTPPTQPVPPTPLGPVVPSPPPQVNEPVASEPVIVAAPASGEQPRSRRVSDVRVVAVAAIVVGLILAMFLLGLLFGLVMDGDDSEPPPEDDPVIVMTTPSASTTVTTSTAATPPTSVPSSSPPGLLPGDGPRPDLGEPDERDDPPADTEIPEDQPR